MVIAHGPTHLPKKAPRQTMQRNILQHGNIETAITIKGFNTL
jgi:hypothetical protein